MINPKDIEMMNSKEDSLPKELIDEFTDSYVEDDEYKQPHVKTTISEEK